MTTLYKPVLIESAEQAEALPPGTIAHDPPSGFAYIKTGRNTWRETASEHTYTDCTILPVTALIPTTTIHELAEEWSNTSDRGWYSSFGDELLEVLAGRPHG